VGPGGLVATVALVELVVGPVARVELVVVSHHHRVAAGQPVGKAVLLFVVVAW
jgi:hypothetical protein